MIENTPERIYGWLGSQLSVARFYGACTFNGAKYIIAYDEEDQPLVRSDVKFPKQPLRSKVKPETTTAPNAGIKASRKAVESLT